MMNQPNANARQRLAGLLSALLLLLVFAPIWQNWARRPADNFPLSYYPMFSQNRAGKTSVTYLVGVDAHGNQHFVAYQHAGTGGMNQVRKTIQKRARKDPANLCRKVARSVARQAAAPDVLLDSIKIIRGDFELGRFFSGNHVPLRSQELCACAVSRSSATTLASTKP